MRVVCLAAAMGAYGLQLSGTVNNSASSKNPRVAVLLVGMPRGWTHDYVKDLRDGVVDLHGADVFVHMCDEDYDLNGLVKQIGSPVVEVLDDCLTEGGPHAQFWHLHEAFDMMKEHETRKGFTYDVVIKMRTEISPAASNGGSIDLAGWEQKGRLHMMTDMIFWGQRREMAVMADLFDSIESFYAVEYPNPFDRPIDVKALYETYLRDPRNEPNVTKKAPWYAYNKLEAVPYPDMVRGGAIENLQAALDKGITVCPSAQCSLRCGERYDLLCENGDDSVCGKFGCRNHADYVTGSCVAEKDILTWPLAHGIILCDIGKSYNPYRGKTGVVARESRDCDE